MRARFFRDEELAPYLVRVPPDWKKVLDQVDSIFFWRDGTQVGLSVAEYDGDVWIHVSATKRYGPTQFAIPSYATMAAVKADFFGPERHAYMVFPTKDEHVNLHPAVLHLWARADGSRQLPDFRVIEDGVVGI